jgi:hypothetical protein
LRRPGTRLAKARLFVVVKTNPGTSMNGIIYLVGLIVVVMAILSFVGLR